MIIRKHALLLLVVGFLLAGCGVQPDNNHVTVAGTTFPNTEGERHWLHFRDAVEANADA
jgi:hypothetical protein